MAHIRYPMITPIWPLDHEPVLGHFFLMPGASIVLTCGLWGPKGQVAMASISEKPADYFRPNLGLPQAQGPRVFYLEGQGI